MFSWTQVFAGRSLFAHSDSRPSRRIYDILHHDEILCMTSHLRYCDVPILPLDALRDVRGGTFRIKLCIKITQNFTHPYFISEPCLHLNKYRRYCDTRHSSNPSTGGRGGNHGYIRRSFYLRSSFSSRPSPEQHLYQMQYTISGLIWWRDSFILLDFTIVYYPICRLLFRKYPVFSSAVSYITIEGRYCKLVLGKLIVTQFLTPASPPPGGRGGHHGYIRRPFYLRSSFSSRPSPEQHLYQMQYTISGSIHIRRRDPFVPLDFTIVHYLICRLLFRKYSAYNFALFYITIEGRYFKLVLGKLSDAIPDPGLPTHRG